MAKRPVSAVGNKRPISQYAKQAAITRGDPRYKVWRHHNLSPFSINGSEFTEVEIHYLWL